MMQLEKIFYPTDSNTIASPTDIISGLLPLIQNCTTVEFPETLLTYVGKITNKRPGDIDTICETFSRLLEDTEIRDKKLEDPGVLKTFGQALGFALSEEINAGLGDVRADDDIGNLSIDRTNVRLTAALLSASAIKHKLQHVEQHIPLYTVLLGLQSPHSIPEPWTKEVYGLVAIIHLAIVGDMMREALASNYPGEDKVIQALKSLKQKRILKSPSSIKLLELVIANAESGYSNNISLNEVWDLLFPTSDQQQPVFHSSLENLFSYLPYFALGFIWFHSFL